MNYYFQIVIYISQITVFIFLLYFDQINVGLVSTKDVFQKYFKKSQRSVLSVKNCKLIFNVFRLFFLERPDPPYNINLSSEPLEFTWDMDCDRVGPLDKSCQVQYRARNHMLDWIEVRGERETRLI